MNLSCREQSASPTDWRPCELQLVTCWAGKAYVWSLRPDATYEIGRAPDAKICIDYQSVSRRHAVLVFEGDTLTIEDLGSSNGTWVDGERLARGERKSVSPGSVIEIGPVPLALELHAATRDQGGRSDAVRRLLVVQRNLSPAPA